MRPFVSGVLAEFATRLGLVVLDGGTDTGVMRLTGRARADSGGGFPLVGVVVSALAALPGRLTGPRAAELGPNHTHLVFLPGASWGEEGPWLTRLGGKVGDVSQSARLLINGGEGSRRDAQRAVETGRPLIVLEGSVAECTEKTAAGAEETG